MNETFAIENILKPGENVLASFLPENTKRQKDPQTIPNIIVTTKRLIIQKETRGLHRKSRLSLIGLDSIVQAEWGFERNLGLLILGIFILLLSLGFFVFSPFMVWLKLDTDLADIVWGIVLLIIGGILIFAYVKTSSRVISIENACGKSVVPCEGLSPARVDELFSLLSKNMH